MKERIPLPLPLPLPSAPPPPKVELSCERCRLAELIVESDGTVKKVRCHAKAPRPELVPSGGAGSDLEVVFPTLYLPNFCGEIVLVHS